MVLQNRFENVCFAILFISGMRFVWRIFTTDIVIPSVKVHFHKTKLGER